jgi:hypothetical protein
MWKWGNLPETCQVSGDLGFCRHPAGNLLLYSGVVIAWIAWKTDRKFTICNDVQIEKTNDDEELLRSYIPILAG